VNVWAAPAYLLEQGWMRECGLLDLTDPDGARYDQTVLA